MGRGRARAIVGVAVVLSCCACAFALDPSLDVSQYAHTAWKVRDGFTKGSITSIAQTPDGYLWLGTEFGLVRFDGVRAVPWRPPTGEDLPGSHITSLRVAHDGTLWIGTFEGLASWNGTTVSEYPEIAGQPVSTVLEDREGTVWVGTSGSSGRICAIQSGTAQCYGEDGSLGRFVLSLYEDSGGNLWAGAQTGLWRWKPGPPKLYPMRGSKGQISYVTEGDNGAILFVMGDGIKQLVGGKIEPYQLQIAGVDFKPSRLLRDRNGGLWIGTSDRGLFHVHQGKVDGFQQSDGLSGNFVVGLFEDREGNIWVVTADGGLDHFRDFVVSTITTKQGLSNNSVWSVLGARDGSVWFGTTTGLNRWKGGQITVYRKHAQAVSSRPNRELNAREIFDNGLPDSSVDSLFQDDRGRIWVSTLSGFAYFDNDRFVPVSALPAGIVLSIAGDGVENLWISDRTNGLLHLLRGSVVEQIPWTALERKDAAFSLLADPENGGLWVGFVEGGLAYLKNGEVRASYRVSDGLGKGYVWGLHGGPKGVLWAATQGGLSRVKEGRVATLTSKNGLPCDTVHWMMEDNDHAVWLYMACGLARISRSELDAWVSDVKRRVQVTVFDSTDGVRSHANNSGFSPRVAKSADGKLWFMPGDGVSVIDPRHLPVNKLPPPVHVEEIIADGKTYDASSGLRLPPRVHNLEIHYTALSLVAPEKVRFRIKLEGQDPDWREQTDRHENYTNLGPGNYRFRVMACNNSGVWNEQGASLDFAIAPAYYQTNWFRALCVLTFLAMLWMVYELRVHQLARQFNMTLEARVNERTRIARDLHDTLLQNFHGVLGRLQAVSNDLPEGKSKEQLESTIDQAAEAITEGRDAVQGLRTSTVERNDLALAIRTVGEELAADPSNGRADFEVHVEGAPRDIQPILRDEIYRIAAEALRNAFRHAQARRIEADLRYGERQFGLRVRDDGKGIDPKVLGGDGREGHFGLHGMRERAKLAGGKLTIWSQLDAGTEIELTIPASTAYGTERRSWLAERLSRKATEMREKMKS